MKKIKLMLILFGIFAALFWLLNYFNSVQLQPFSKEVNFVKFNPNLSIDKTAELLNKNKLIKNQDLFTKYLKSLNKKLVTKPVYLSASMSGYDISKTLVGEHVKSLDKTLVIGYNKTLKKLQTDVNLQLNRDENELLKISKNQDFIKKIKSKFSFINPNKMLNQEIEYYLEGYLISGKYQINLTQNFEEILIKILDKTQHVYEKNFSAMKNKGLSMHGLLSMASCLSAEAGVYTNQYKDIAGVFWNRLYKPMPLQLDATFIYGYNHGLKTRGNVEDITIGQMQTQDVSQYNTYNKKGLPVGPITSVSELQIDAVLNPNKHEYLFYYHYDDNGTRKIKLSKTYEEHITNLKR